MHFFSHFILNIGAGVNELIHFIEIQLRLVLNLALSVILKQWFTDEYKGSWGVSQDKQEVMFKNIVLWYKFLTFI